MNSYNLFVGLGNPGPEYTETRHNFGFLLADTLVESCRLHGTVTSLSGKNKKVEAWKCILPLPLPAAQKEWIIAKPQTFMNKSGEAVSTLMQFYKIPLSQMVVAHDELDIPFGSMRFKFGGGAAGHNGIRSICDCTGGKDFYRLRLGIGKPVGYDVSSFVLGRFTKQEREACMAILQAGRDGFYTFCEKGLKEAQQFINSFTFSPK